MKLNWLEDVKIRNKNWKASLMRYELPKQGKVWYAGWVHHSRKHLRAEKLMGTEWESDGVTVYQDGRMSFDWQGWVSPLISAALKKKCKF